MEIPVLIERVVANGYRASTRDPFRLTAEGSTLTEALRNLRELVQSRVADAHLTVQDVGPFSHPWDRFVGKWADDDPLIAEWEKEVEAYRREVDENPNIP
jgi:predicted RNase H-like HicB family nuclease